MRFGSVDEVLHHWAARILGDPRLAEQLEHTFAFEILEDSDLPHLRRWVFQPGPPPKVVEGEGRAECTVSVSAPTLLRLANNELNPQAAYLSGALKLKGQIENALRLHVLFRQELQTDAVM
jgi:putative sterol carrier protein